MPKPSRKPASTSSARAPGAGQRLALDQLAHVEGDGVSPPEHQPEDRQQDRQRAGQRVDEELERRGHGVAVAPAADQEVHADEAEVEEDVEDQQVEREEQPSDAASRNRNQA